MTGWQCGDRRLDLSRPRIMGVLNVTPDSFSDGGRWLHTQQAVDLAGGMLEQGADIIDVGGESTRPGAAEVSSATEIDRVMPVLTALRAAFPDAWLSLDSSKAEVLRAASACRVDIINDVRALRDPEMLETAAASGCGICLMHMQKQPRNMQQAPHYREILSEVATFLAQRVQACLAAGVRAERVVVDPGFGFGKTLAHNTRLLAGLALLQQELELRLHTRFPLLVGLSRKSMLAGLLAAYNKAGHEPGHAAGSADYPPLQRVLAGSVAAAIAVLHGASIVRTHDVTETRDALAVVVAVQADAGGNQYSG